MNKQALYFAWAVIAIGMSIVAAASLQWQSTNVAAFFSCLVLAVFASTRKVKLPRLTGTISPGFVFLLVAVATLSWTETIAIAVVSGLVQSLWRPKNRPSALQIAFAAATLAISGTLAFKVTAMLVALGGTHGLPVILAVAGVVLLVTNGLLVATVVSLLQEAPFYTAWRTLQVRAVPYYLAGGLIANIWAQTDPSASVGFAVVAALSVYLLSVCYREFENITLGLGERKGYV